MTEARYQNQSAERSFAILECVDAAENPVPLAVIARETGLNRATVFRMLAVLTRMGWIYKNETDATYALGHKAFALGRRRNHLETIVHHARPFIRRLARDLEETVQLAALEGPQIVYCDKVVPPDGHSVSTAVGMRLDAHATGAGKAMLTWLAPDEVRDLYRQHPPVGHTPRTITIVDALVRELEVIRLQGYAVDEGEMIPGLACVAAPVLNTLGRAVAALSVSAPASGFDPARVARLAGRLTATATELSDYIADHDSRTDSR
ncbi:MAG: IclR family transcriptional regulator [Alphaproteobacteria bacterium]